MRNYGLNKYEIKNDLIAKIKKNPDIYYYLDDQYVEQIIDSLVEGIAEVIEKNNIKLIESFTRELTRKF